MDIQAIKARFEAKYQKGEPDECWEWTASRNGLGYGSCSASLYGEQLAHRVAYRLAYGDIPEGHSICHTCDNPPCVNPDHLFAGTHAENMADAAGKGRIRCPGMPGESNPVSKFTQADKDDMVQRYLDGEKQADIAARYGAHRGTVRKVVKKHCDFDGRTRRGGSLNVNSKLTDDQVREVRRRYRLGESQQAIADDYGVSQVAVSCIIRRKTYAHLD